MNVQDFGLKQRVESIQTDAVQFAEAMRARENHAERAKDVWNGHDKENRAKSDELRERLHALMVDLALVMERSPLINKGDIRDLARSGRRMSAALRFEEYTGSMLRQGDPIRAFEAQMILEDGFRAMAEWIALLLPGRRSTAASEQSD